MFFIVIKSEAREGDRTWKLDRARRLNRLLVYYPTKQCYRGLSLNQLVFLSKHLTLTSLFSHELDNLVG